MTTAQRPSADEAFLAKLMRVGGAFQESKILFAGVSLGLFDRLAAGPATAAELAADLGLTVRGVAILADALVATGYLTKAAERYASTPEADRYLVRGRPASQAHIMRHRNETFGHWARLEDIIRHGQTLREHEKPTLADREANRNFILGMAEASRTRVGPVLDALPLAGARRFVDLGGGPGHCACEAARRHPELEALVVDLPLTIEVAREYIAGAGLSARVATAVCDFYREPALDLGAPADVVLISQVLHAEGPDENRALLRKLAAGVRPGGAVAVSENLVDEDRTAPLAGALFAVNMLAGTERGRTYTATEIASWLDEAGFTPQPAVTVAERAAVVIGTRRGG